MMASQRLADLGARCQDVGTGSRHDGIGREGSKNVVMPTRKARRGSVVQVVDGTVEAGVGKLNQRIQQRHEDGFLGREVEVERRAGQAGALGQVVDGDVGELLLLQQADGGGENGGLPVIAGRPRSDDDHVPERAGFWGAHGEYLTRC